MDIHNLTAKDIKKLHIWLRALIQVLYFLFIPSVYTAAFAGVKYIFTQIGAGEKVAMTSFVTVLVVICIYTILYGKALLSEIYCTGTDFNPVLCRRLQQGKRNQPVGCIFHAPCRQL